MSLNTAIFEKTRKNALQVAKFSANRFLYMLINDNASWFEQSEAEIALFSLEMCASREQTNALLTILRECSLAEFCEKIQSKPNIEGSKLFFAMFSPSVNLPFGSRAPDPWDLKVEASNDCYYFIDQISFIYVWEVLLQIYMLHNVHQIKKSFSSLFD